MNRLPYRLLLLLPVSLLLGPAGCSQPEVRYQREDYPFEQLLSERVAVGGFVLSARLRDDPTARAEADTSLPATVRQSRAWTPQLETNLYVHAPELDRRSYASVEDQVDLRLLRDCLRLHARGSVLKDAQLESLAADLPGVRYLLLGRLDRNESSLESQELDTGVLENNPTGLGKPGGDADARPLDRTRWYLRREVAATLELYDLQGGLSIWSASVAVDENQLLDGESGAAEPDIRVERDPDREGGVRITGEGGLRGGPELEGLLDEASRKLVGELMELARPKPVPAHD